MSSDPDDAAPDHVVLLRDHAARLSARAAAFRGAPSCRIRASRADADLLVNLAVDCERVAGLHGRLRDTVPEDAVWSRGVNHLLLLLSTLTVLSSDPRAHGWGLSEADKHVGVQIRVMTGALIGLAPTHGVLSPEQAKRVARRTMAHRSDDLCRAADLVATVAGAGTYEGHPADDALALAHVADYLRAHAAALAAMDHDGLSRVEALIRNGNDRPAPDSTIRALNPRRA